MSLYHETAEVLTAESKSSLKSRIFGEKSFKSKPTQIYALAAESCLWSPILKEVIENADLLRVEGKVSFLCLFHKD